VSEWLSGSGMGKEVRCLRVAVDHVGGRELSSHDERIHDDGLRHYLHSQASQRCILQLSKPLNSGGVRELQRGVQTAGALARP